MSKLAIIILVSFIIFVFTGSICINDQIGKTYPYPRECHVLEKYQTDRFILVLYDQPFIKTFSKDVKPEIFYKAKKGETLKLDVSLSDMDQDHSSVLIFFNECIMLMSFVVLILSLITYSDPYHY